MTIETSEERVESEEVIVKKEGTKEKRSAAEHRDCARSCSDVDCNDLQVVCF